MHQRPSWEANSTLNWTRISPHFMEPQYLKLHGKLLKLFGKQVNILLKYFLTKMLICYSYWLLTWNCISILLGNYARCYTITKMYVCRKKNRRLQIGNPWTVWFCCIHSILSEGWWPYLQWDFTCEESIVISMSPSLQMTVLLVVGETLVPKATM